MWTLSLRSKSLAQRAVAGTFHDQRESVTQNKTDAEWLYDSTPTSVFTLNDQVLAVISTSLVSAIQ